MKWRLVAAFIGMTIVVLIAHDVPLTSYLRRVETQRFLAGIERDAFIIGGSSEDRLSGDEPGGTGNLQQTAALYASRQGAQVVITDRTGIAVASSDDGGRVGEDYSNRPEVATALTGLPTSGTRHSDTADTDLVYVAVPILSGADIVGAVRITYPESIIDDRTNTRVRGLYLVGLISLVGATIAALFVAGTLTRPLQRLRRATQQLAAGDLSTTADVTEGPPEIRDLAESFNEMTERIHALVEQQRAFAGDASHQLRTPLTALRLQLEQGAALLDTDPDGARTRIEAATAETERLQQVISGLLVLARAEHTTLATEPVDVSAVVAERVELWSAIAAERSIEVRGEGIDPLRPSQAIAVGGALEQMLDNLLDNAIQIGPERTTIVVRVDMDDVHAVVHVLDEGPGMTDEQLAYARNRFWRAPDAPHQGSGLGLAIVDHLATAGGGSVALVNRPTGGLDVAVSLRRRA